MPGSDTFGTDTFGGCVCPGTSAEGAAGARGPTPEFGTSGIETNTPGVTPGGTANCPCPTVSPGLGVGTAGEAGTGSAGIAGGTSGVPGTGTATGPAGTGSGVGTGTGTGAAGSSPGVGGGPGSTGAIGTPGSSGAGTR